MKNTKHARRLAQGALLVAKSNWMSTEQKILTDDVVMFLSYVEDRNHLSQDQDRMIVLCHGTKVRLIATLGNNIEFLQEC